MITQSVCCSVIWMESLLLCFGRPGAAPCRCSWVERLYSLQPIWCAHLDAPAVNGPECSPQWHTTYWSMCNPLLITLYCCSGITSQPHFFPTVLALVVNYICALSIIWWVANNWMKIEKIASFCFVSFQMTVKKTLSNFRRTHHDNWQQHKQQFTDDQLLVLTDLLVSPCYYA